MPLRLPRPIILEGGYELPSIERAVKKAAAELGFKTSVPGEDDYSFQEKKPYHFFEDGKVRSEDLTQIDILGSADVRAMSVYISGSGRHFMVEPTTSTRATDKTIEGMVQGIYKYLVNPFADESAGEEE